MKRWIHDEKGGILVFAGALIGVIILFAATAIDVSYILTAQNELQSAVDASALAAASGLAESQTEAYQRAFSVSNNNRVMQQPLSLQGNEINFLDHKTVQVTAQRTINLFFARLVQINTKQITASATAECGNRDIMLIFDRSGSMDDDTVDPEVPQPLTDTKYAATHFLGCVANNPFVLDRIGLVSYSTDAQLHMALGRNFRQMKRTIESYTAGGYTNIGEAIRISSEHLNQESAMRTKKTIILLSDGMANKPGYGLPTNDTAIQYALTQTSAAANSSIRIYTISLGNATDINLMNQIAGMTQGEHYHAPTPVELYDIFQEIADRIPAILIS